MRGRGWLATTAPELSYSDRRGPSSDPAFAGPLSPARGEGTLAIGGFSV